MHRCLELAQLGAGYVAPNPMVGAVLLHKGRIIGEGWHKEYGEAHAEVNCTSVKKPTAREDVSLLIENFPDDGPPELIQQLGRWMQSLREE